MDIRIRPATLQDYEALLPLFEDIDAQHRQHHPERFQKPAGPAREREFLLAALADEQTGFFVAEANGDLVGHVHVIVRETPPLPILKPRRFAHIDEIVVKAAYRGQGVGHLLMKQAEAWAVAQGATAIELGVYEFNQQAQEFYRDLGYGTFHQRMGKELKEA
jgi:ribosomal protein S18 acetylase RimI-like enzyme